MFFFFLPIQVMKSIIFGLLTKKFEALSFVGKRTNIIENGNQQTPKLPMTTIIIVVILKYNVDNLTLSLPQRGGQNLLFLNWFLLGKFPLCQGGTSPYIPLFLIHNFIRELLNFLDVETLLNGVRSSLGVFMGFVWQTTLFSPLSALGRKPRGLHNHWSELSQQSVGIQVILRSEMLNPGDKRSVNLTYWFTLLAWNCFFL